MRHWFQKVTHAFGVGRQNSTCGDAVHVCERRERRPVSVTACPSEYRLVGFRHRVFHRGCVVFSSVCFCVSPLLCCLRQCFLVSPWFYCVVFMCLSFVLWSCTGASPRFVCGCFSVFCVSPEFLKSFAMVFAVRQTTSVCACKEHFLLKKRNDCRAKWPIQRRGAKTTRPQNKLWRHVVKLENKSQTMFCIFECVSKTELTIGNARNMLIPRAEHMLHACCGFFLKQNAQINAQ